MLILSVPRSSLPNTAMYTSAFKSQTWTQPYSSKDVFYSQEDPHLSAVLSLEHPTLLLKAGAAAATLFPSYKPRASRLFPPAKPTGNGASLDNPPIKNTLQQLDGFSKRSIQKCTRSRWHLSYHLLSSNFSQCWLHTKHTSFPWPGRSTWRRPWSPVQRGGLATLWREVRTSAIPAALGARAELWAQAALPLLERRLQSVTLGKDTATGYELVLHQPQTHAAASWDQERVIVHACQIHPSAC